MFSPRKQNNKWSKANVFFTAKQIDTSDTAGKSIEKKLIMLLCNLTKSIFCSVTIYETIR